MNNMAASYPKISVVTPSYNQGEFIEETILSVINQNYPNLEYIVIDGGSTDGSVEIIKKYEQHFTYWVSEPDKGHANALNKGFARATGEIMAWINSDDKYFPWAFATVAEVYNQFPDINWTVGLYANFDRDGILMSGSNNVRATYKNIYSYVFRDLHIQQESVFWRRSLWEKAGGYIDEKVHLMVDTELWCRFFLYSDLWHIDRVIGGYRTYGLNRSHVQVAEVEHDIEISIGNLLKNLPEQKKTLLRRMNEYKVLYKQYNENIGNITGRIRKNKLLQLLPHFLYNKMCDFIFLQVTKRKRIAAPAMPKDGSTVFKKVERENEGWKKVELPYLFPY